MAKPNGPSYTFDFERLTCELIKL